MKTKFPTNKEVLKIERQRAIKGYHYVMRFACLLLMMVYLAIWFSYKSQSQALDYNVWFKMAIVTALMASIQLSFWFFGYLRHWLTGGIVGVILILPYLFLISILPNKSKVEYKNIEELEHKKEVLPEIKVMQNSEILLKKTIQLIQEKYPNTKTNHLILKGLKVYQNSQVLSYFNSLYLSDSKILREPVHQGEMFIFRNLKVDAKQLIKLVERFSDKVSYSPELNLIEGIYNEAKFNPQVVNPAAIGNGSENQRQMKVAAGWLNTLYGHKPMDLKSALINLKNTENRAYFADIEKKLTSLLFEPYVMVDKSLIFQAYVAWVKEINVDREAVITRYFHQQKKQNQVDDFLLELVFEFLPEESLSLVESRWKKNLRDWESLLMSQPAIAESRLLEIYNTLNLNQKKSALKILAKTGNAESLRFIEQRLKISKIEERIFLKSAASTIKTRLVN